MKKFLFTLILLVSGFTQAQTFDFSCSATSELQTATEYWNSLWAQNEAWSSSKVSSPTIQLQSGGVNTGNSITPGHWYATNGDVEIKLHHNLLVNDMFGTYAVPFNNENQNELFVVTSSGNHPSITIPNKSLNTVTKITEFMDAIYGAYTHVASDSGIAYAIPTGFSEVFESTYDEEWRNDCGDTIYRSGDNFYYQLSGDISSEPFSSIASLLEAFSAFCDGDSISFTEMRDGSITNNQNSLVMVPNDGSTSRTTTITWNVVDREGSDVSEFTGTSQEEARIFVGEYVTIPRLFTIDYDDEVFYHKAIDSVTPGFLFDDYLAQNSVGSIKKGGLVHDGVTNDDGGVISDLDNPVTIETVFNFILSLDGITVRQIDGEWIAGGNGITEERSSTSIYVLYNLIANDILPINSNNYTSANDYFEVDFYNSYFIRINDEGEFILYFQISTDTLEIIGSFDSADEVISYLDSI